MPNEGSHFLLIPAAQAPWRGDADQETRFASLRFDAKGKPLELAKWSQAISAASAVAAATVAKSPTRAKDYTVTTAAGVEKLWGVKLGRQRSLLTEIGGNRMVQVVPGRTEGKSIRQMFTVASNNLYVGRSNRLLARHRNHWLPNKTEREAAFAFKLARESTGFTKATYK